MFCPVCRYLFEVDYWSGSLSYRDFGSVWIRRKERYRMPKHVELLNPHELSLDPTTLRFSHLEVDGRPEEELIPEEDDDEQQ